MKGKRIVSTVLSGMMVFNLLVPGLTAKAASLPVLRDKLNDVLSQGITSSVNDSLQPQKIPLPTDIFYQNGRYEKVHGITSSDTNLITNDGIVLATDSDKNVDVTYSLKKVNAPDKLVITEVKPDSNEIGGDDAYEYIELYNGASTPIDMSTVQIIYNNGKQDYYFDSANKVLGPHEVFIYAICSFRCSRQATMQEFCDNYGVTIPESNFYYNYKESMANNDPRVITLKYNGSVQQTVRYNGKATTADGYMYDEKFAGDGNYDVTPGTAKGTPYSVKFSENANDLRTEKYTFTVKKPKDVDNYYAGALQNIVVPSEVGLWETVSIKDVSVPPLLQPIEFKSSNTAIINDQRMAINIGNKVPVTVKFRPNQLDDLVISEVMVKDVNFTTGDPKYEYIELYNPTDRILTLNEYSLTYNNGNDNYGLGFAGQVGAKTLAPGETFVYGICSNDITAPTLEQFNAQYNSSVPADKFALYHGIKGLGCYGANRTLTMQHGQKKTIVNWSEVMCQTAETVLQVYQTGDVTKSWIGRPSPGVQLKNVFTVEKTYDINVVASSDTSLFNNVEQQLAGLTQAGLYAPNKISFTSFVGADGRKYQPRLESFNLGAIGKFGNMFDVGQDTSAPIKVTLEDITPVPTNDIRIREVAPKGSGQIDGKNAYTFVEVYNGTDTDVAADRVKITYYYPGPVNTDTETIQGKSGNIIPAKGTYIFALAHKDIDKLEEPTREQFNNQYDVEIPDINFQYYQEISGMAESGERKWGLTVDGTLVQRVTFDGKNLDVDGKGFVYSLTDPLLGSTAMPYQALKEASPGSGVNDLISNQSKQYSLIVKQNPTITNLKVDDTKFNTINVKTAISVGQDIMQATTIPGYTLATLSSDLSKLTHAGRATGTGTATFSVVLKPEAVNDLLISEIMVSPESQATPKYQYIEIYNGGSEPKTMSEYRIIYNNGSTNYGWDISKSVSLLPGETFVFAITSSNISPVTLDEFNAFYGTSIPVTHFQVYNGALGMGVSRGLERTVTLQKKAGSENVSQRKYTGQLAGSVGMAINYYSPLTDLTLNASGTPGRVMDSIYGAKKSYNVSIGSDTAVSLVGTGASIIGEPQANTTMDYTFYIKLDPGYTLVTPGQISYQIGSGAVKQLSNTAGLYRIPKAEIKDQIKIVAGTKIVDYSAQTNTVKQEFPAFAQIAQPDVLLDESSLMGNYIPQGMAYSEAKNWLMLGAYHQDGDDSGMISIYDYATRKIIKNVKILNKDGTPNKSHMGGLIANDNSVWITGEGFLYRIPLSALESAKDMETVNIVEQKSIKNTAAFGSYSNGILWVGEFGYSFGGFDVDSSHKDGSNQGLLYGFEVAANSATIPDVPRYVISLPQKIQGAAVDPNNQLYLSQSYGRDNESTLWTISDFTKLPKIQKTLDDGRSYTIYQVNEANSKVTMPNMTQNLSYISSAQSVLVNTEAPALKFRSDVGSKCTQYVWKIPVGGIVSIITHPQSVVSKTEENITLAVGVDSTLTVDSYKWYKNGLEIAGQNSASYTISNAKVSDSGDYTAKVIVGTKEATSNPATVNVVDTNIQSFSIKNVSVSTQIDKANKTIKIFVPNTTNLTALIPEFSIDENSTAVVKSVVQTSGGMSQNFTDPVTYTVGKQGILVDNWTVTIIKETVVTIQGTAKYGETLTALLENSDPAGTYTYQWKQGETNIGENKNTYVITENDIGKTISVTVSGTGIVNPVSSAASAKVAKLDAPATPDAPVISSQTATSVTLEAVQGAEYSSNGGVKWQDANVFLNLIPEMEYSFCIRIKETETRYASQMSQSTDNTQVDTSFKTFSLKIAHTVEIDRNNYTIILKVAADVNVAKLIPVFELGANSVATVNGIVQESGTTENDFTNDVVYTVGAANGPGKDWTVKIVKSGYATMQGIAKYGQTLTAVVVGETQNAGYTYQWLRDDQVIENATQSTYTVTEADIGKKLQVKVEGGTLPEPVTSAKSEIVEKADAPAAIAPPTIIARTADSITLALVDKAEYSRNGIEWQDSNVFSNLSKGETYPFFVRLKETTTHKSSLKSEPLTAVMNDMVFEQYSFDGVNSSPVINQARKTIVFTVPADTVLNNLTAIFTVPSGVSVKIGDVVQESNVTTNDFSTPIKYMLEMLGADPVEWSVIVAKESQVSINGKPKLLQTLNAEIAGGDQGDTIEYQWKRNGVNIDGAVNKDYVVTKEDIAQIITVEVNITNAELEKHVTLTSKSVVVESVNGINGIKVSFEAKGKSRRATAVLYELADIHNSKPVSEIKSVMSGDVLKFSNIPNGVYKTVITAKGHAPVTLKGIIVEDSTTQVNQNVLLRVGDLDDDKIISMTDLSKLLKQYLKNDDLSDFNEDTVVDMLDFSMQLKNYNFKSMDIDVAP